MNKKLDVSKVDAALQRAARAATTGSRDERAGRFVVRETDSGRLSDKPTKARSGKDRRA
jgi:hypothetical protein